MVCHTGRLWRRHLMPCQNITPATVLPNFDRLPCQGTERFMSHLPRPADRWLSQTFEWMHGTTLRNTLADPFTFYLFTYTVPGSCDVWLGINLFSKAVITPWLHHDSLHQHKTFSSMTNLMKKKTCKTLLVLDKMSFSHASIASFFSVWLVKNVKPWHYSLPWSYWLFLLPGAFCTDGVANWKTLHSVFPFALAGPAHTSCFGYLDHVNCSCIWQQPARMRVLNKSLDERAETAGLGVLFPREPARRWWLWNRVGNRWCADAHS